MAGWGRTTARPAGGCARRVALVGDASLTHPTKLLRSCNVRMVGSCARGHSIRQARSTSTGVAVRPARSASLIASHSPQPFQHAAHHQGEVERQGLGDAMPAQALELARAREAAGYPARGGQEKARVEAQRKACRGDGAAEIVQPRQPRRVAEGEAGFLLQFACRRDGQRAGQRRDGGGGERRSTAGRSSEAAGASASPGSTAPPGNTRRFGMKR